MSRCGQEVGSAGLQEKFVPPSGTSACTVVQQYETVVSVRERLLRRVVTHQKALSQVKLRPKREGSVGGRGHTLADRCLVLVLLAHWDDPAPCLEIIQQRLGLK